MTPWLIAAVAGLGLAALLLAALRAGAVTLLVALMLDARAGRAASMPPLVVLDASRSWMRGDSLRWNAAMRDARARGGDSLHLFGDSLRLAGEAPQPADTRSAFAAVAEMAGAQGRPVVVYTDGELPVGDAARVARLPRGSQLVVRAAPAAADRAVVGIEAPRAVAGGDTLRVRVVLRTGAAPVGATTLALHLDSTAIATAAIEAAPASTTREATFAVRMPPADGSRLLRAIIQGSDAERRNDTMTVALDVSAATAAIWVSSAPDLDGRAALAVLRGSLAVPTRAFLRVAPGAWRIEGTLAPVSEAEVRRAIAAAPMLVIHGDTAVFGPPRALGGDAPLALLPGPARDAGGAPGGTTADVLDEWYPSGAPASPASSALAGVAWDSLPPVSLGAAATGDARRGLRGWVAMEGRRARRGEPQPLVVGTESPRRVVVARATGMWRWQSRGGPGEVAYQGLWGSIFDWMADARRDRRAAVPALASVREGDAVRWRVAATDGATPSIVLRRRGADGRVDTVPLAPIPGTTMAESPSLAAGIYDVEAPGGRSILAVNVAAELLPAAPTVETGAQGDGPVSGTAPALREQGLAYAAIVLLLCVEWVLRRQQGLA